MSRWMINISVAAMMITAMATTGVTGEPRPATAAEKPGRLIDYVPSSIDQPEAQPRDPIADSLRFEKWEGTNKVNRLTQKRELTEADRWIRFEDEFTPRERYNTVIQDKLVGIKYQLDKTVFALDQFVQDAEKMLEFEYAFHAISLPSDGNGKSDGKGVSGQRRARRYYATPWEDILDNARFRTDVELDFNDPFIGVRLDFPIMD